jgi:hypothetical protein
VAAGVVVLADVTHFICFWIFSDCVTEIIEPRGYVAVLSVAVLSVAVLSVAVCCSVECCSVECCSVEC